MNLQANRSLLRTLDVFQESVLLLDTAQPEWRVLYANEAWTQTTGKLQLLAACSIVHHLFWTNSLVRPTAGGLAMDTMLYL